MIAKRLFGSSELTVKVREASELENLTLKKRDDLNANTPFTISEMLRLKVANHSKLHRMGLFVSMGSLACINSMSWLYDASNVLVYQKMNSYIIFKTRKHHLSNFGDLILAKRVVCISSKVSPMVFNWVAMSTIATEDIARLWFSVVEGDGVM